jgi:hypothetical protein
MSHSFLLFYAEDGDRFSEFIPWADWWGSMYGLRPIIIDPTGKWKTSKDGLLRAYESLGQDQDPSGGASGGVVVSDVSAGSRL